MEGIVNCVNLIIILKQKGYVFIKFDFKSHLDLKNIFNEIKRLSTIYTNLVNIDKYILSGIVCILYSNHYTFYLNNFKSKNIKNFDLNKNYYYDDIENDGKFVQIDNLEII